MTYDVDMDSIVEATSLSAVTGLAANPPAHPNIGIPPNSQPLVLYIARVPGSRDVFLTPMKPRDKVVTAGDVQSSLYYVHVNGAEDYEPSEPPQRPSSVNTNASQLPPVLEKPKKIAPPLPHRSRSPGTPPYPVDDPMPVIQAQVPSPPRQQQVLRKPVLPDRTNRPSSHHPLPDLPDIPRRPLPTPPEEPARHPSLHDENIRLLRHSEHTDSFNNPYSVDFPNHPETVKQLDLDSRPESGTLTLIRRDPGSNSQWNVASIHDPPVPELSSSSLLAPTASRRTKKGGAPLYLDITNPGYTQFIDHPQRTESRTSTSSTSSDTDPAPEGIFRRRLYMPGSRFAEHGYGGHRKYLSVSSASGETANDDLLRRTLRDGRPSSVDLGSISEQPTADRRTKGYTFTSPWSGTCEFTTGATGKSLKCRHHLPNNARGNGPSGGTSVEVSELRFNLPTSTKTPISEKRSSYFSRHRHSAFLSSPSGDGSTSPTIMLNDDGRIDLSLGQERAGGGFGGKQAKLGKLIVMPEGFGMLDLLVAANVGLWWRAWEKV